MTELSLTRIFSVTMYYHFAFMAISIALFGLSASGVYVFLMRDRWHEVPTERLLVRHSLLFTALTLRVSGGDWALVVPYRCRRIRRLLTTGVILTTGTDSEDCG